MANINEILQRAASLRDETALNSISPERAGGIMYDTLIALNELWLQQGSALVISKIYASVSAMEADTAPVSDLTGQPLRPGQIVVIASSDSDNGSVYRYNGTTSPSWTSVGKIGNLEPVDSLDSDSTSLPLAAHQGKVLDGKISQLGQRMTDELYDVVKLPIAETYTFPDKVATVSVGNLYTPTVVGNNYGAFSVSNLVGRKISLKTTLLSGQSVVCVIVGANNAVISFETSPTLSVDKEIIVPENALWIYLNYDATTTPEVSAIDEKSKFEKSGLVVGDNTPLEDVWSGDISVLKGTFTLNSTLTMADGQALQGQNCVISCGENAKIIAGNSSIISGIKFLGGWSPTRVHGDGVTYTQFGYEPIKFIHDGESEPTYMTIDDLKNSVTDALVGPGKSSDDCLIDVTIDKAYNTTIKNCIFEGFDRVAVRMASRRHTESSNGQICNNYFHNCWCGVFLSGEFIRLHGNEYTACPIGLCSYASNLNQYGEIFKCCDCGILMAASYTGHSELTATQIAHSGLATIYMRGVPKTLGMQICNCHLVDGLIGGFDLNNVLIVSGRLDVYFQYEGNGSGNSIICSNIGRGYLYGHDLYDVPADTLITLNRGLTTCTDAQANNQA